MPDSPIGAFTFVLHAHEPYVRLAGRWPHGEEWLHEAACDTYIPLLIALHDLAGEGVPFRLTINITPVLAEQLADPAVIEHLDAYLAGQCARAQSDIERFERAGDAHRASVARFYGDEYGRMLAAFRGRMKSDIIGAFRELQDGGYVDIATSAATHAYLPLLERDSSVRAQVALGVRSHRRRFGRAPESFWLPECSYRPAMIAAGGAARPPLEKFLEAEDLRVFFVDAPTLEGGRLLRGGVPTTFEAYRAGGSGVAVIGRNQAAVRQVWSRLGYPGDAAYREFNSRDSESGLRYWRISGGDVSLDDKLFYDPAATVSHVAAQAAHFVGLVRDELSMHAASGGPLGIMAAIYDAELFGHWWYEGVAWLQAVLRQLAREADVEPTSAAQFIRDHPPREAIEMPAGSWGTNGNDDTWLNGKNAWMWETIGAAERRMESIAGTHGDATGDLRAALDQLAREALLLQSSDWPYLVTTEQAHAYAERRFTQHAERFDALASMVESARVSRPYVDEVEVRDRLFPDIEVQDFSRRETDRN